MSARAQHKKFTSLSNNFAESIFSLKQNQGVNGRTSPREYENTVIDLVLTAKASWQHSQMATVWITTAVTVQFETRAGVGQLKTIFRQTGKTAHLPIMGGGASQEGCTEFYLIFCTPPKNQACSFQGQFEWENAHIGGVKTRCLQSYRFCKPPSMRFCGVCMYYCDAVTIMKAWITKWASCTHGSTRENSRDFAKKSMYAKLTTRLTRCHITTWGETSVNIAGKLSWFSA